MQGLSILPDPGSFALSSFLAFDAGVCQFCLILVLALNVTGQSLNVHNVHMHTLVSF